MTHDAVVVGAGVAGLVSALRLAEAGRRVLVLAKGVGCTHLAPSTLDVLGYAPERVESPAAALPGFVEDNPGHPYAVVGPAAVASAVGWFLERFDGYRGGLERNLLLPTAVGVPRPSAAAPASIAAGDLGAGSRLVLAGLRQLRDFHPAYCAANLERSGLGIRARAVDLSPPLHEADVGPVAYARHFEDPGFRAALVKELRPQLEPDEAVGFPAVLGLDDAGEVWADLQEALGTRVFEIPTLPPSVPGIRLYRALTRALAAAGARVVVGTPVRGAETGGGRIEAVIAQSAARPVAYPARAFVLASGGFASGGVEMDSHGAVRETVFGLPVTGVPAAGEPAFSPGYLDPHPIGRAGLAVDGTMRPLGPGGEPVYENLHAAGAVLAGAEPLREKSGEGIAIATGHRAAEAVLESTLEAVR